jgi:hypothetical protein
VWKDCYAQTDTLEEAITEISSVASSLIEPYLEENKPILLKIVQHISCAITPILHKFGDKNRPTEVVEDIHLL